MTPRGTSHINLKNNGYKKKAAPSRRGLTTYIINFKN